MASSAQVGSARVICPVCEQVIACPVTAEVVADPSGLRLGSGSARFDLVCTPDMTDMWAHMWMHEANGDG